MKTQYPITSIYILSILFFAILPSIQAQEIDIPEPVPPPAAIREAFKLDPFYQQWIDVGGFPVIASEKVSPYAVKEAAYLIHKILGHRPDLLQVFAQNRSRFVIIGYAEGFTEIPEYRYLQPSFWFDIRNRGVGSASPYGATSTSEENLLHYPGDVWKENGGSVLIHELAHLVHIVGLEQLDPGFDDRLRRVYEASLKKGLWPGTYGAPNHHEYWAEGVEAWLNPQNTHFVSLLGGTREGLEAYDPELAALVRDVYGDYDWRHTRATTRTHLPHLRGFDPQESPTFEYSADALALNRQLKDPNSTGGGRWIDLEQYLPSELPRLQASRHNGGPTKIFIGNYRGDSQDQDVLLYYVAPDGTEHFHQRFRNEMELRSTYVGALWLLKDNDGKTFAVYQAEAKMGRVLILREAEIDNSPQVKMPDANLAAAVQQELGLAASTLITEQVMQKLTTLGASDREITNLTGLEHATRLVRLDLWENQIQDVSPLSNLTQLRQLHLQANQITDITAFAGLTELKQLHLWGNQIRDISVLANLTKLESLWLAGNPIQDNAPLHSLLKQNPDIELDIDVPQLSPTDVNGDGVVNIQDLVLVASSLGETGPTSADVNGDNIVNIMDLVLVAGELGTP